MKKINLFYTLTVLSVYALTASPTNQSYSKLNSDDLETTLEREMLNDLVYIEDEEEVILNFDPYFHLPIGFNAYEGMEFELKDIEYIELEEYY